MKIPEWTQMHGQLSDARRRYEKAKQSFDAFCDQAMRLNDSRFPLQGFSAALCAENALAITFLGRNMRIAFHFARPSNTGVLRFYDAEDTANPPGAFARVIFDEYGKVADTEPQASGQPHTLWDPGSASQIVLMMANELLGREPDLPPNFEPRRVPR